jgi:hypothetical protein
MSLQITSSTVPTGRSTRSSGAPSTSTAATARATPVSGPTTTTEG